MRKLAKTLKRNPSLLNKALLNWVLRAPNSLSFTRRFRLANLRWRRPLRVSLLDEHQQFLVESDNQKIVVARRARLDHFLNGIHARESMLSSEYLLEKIPIDVDDYVIDIGANIGEFSRLVATRYGALPLAIEPDRREYQALIRNLASTKAITFNALLWSEDAELPFFDANDSGDSSIFASSPDLASEVRQATTLDSLLAEHEHISGAIRLIKLEAEGAEPEVLLGSTRTLERTEYVAADLGPERGLSAETTLTPVYDFLTDRGFRAIGVYPGRLVVLFRQG